ncbi:MAG: hypothetical protein GX596_06960 [Propionibacterium sp.]|nr:hypothetical protein [Propionibacterium sp.]
MDVPAARARERLAEKVGRACGLVRSPEQLLGQVSEILKPALTHVAGAWMVADPDSRIGSTAHAEGCTDELHLALLEQEARGDDVNLMRDVAEHRVAAASLHAATGGELARSRRWREVYGPHGYGDELRGCFNSGETVWGMYTVVRDADVGPFDAGTIQLMTRIRPHVTAALRTTLAVDGIHDGAVEEPGVVILADDDTLRSSTASANQLLGPLSPSGASPDPGYVVHEVAARARAVADGNARGPATARIKVDGGWLELHAAVLDTQERSVAVIVERAPPERSGTLAMELHGITAREREVAELLLAGMELERVAAELWITVETVRGHAKSVFAKLGVHGRAEFMARLAGRRRVEPSMGRG